MYYFFFFFFLLPCVQVKISGSGNWVNGSCVSQGHLQLPVYCHPPSQLNTVSPFSTPSLHQSISPTTHPQFFFLHTPPHHHTHCARPPSLPPASPIHHHPHPPIVLNTVLPPAVSPPAARGGGGCVGPYKGYISRNGRIN